MRGPFNVGARVLVRAPSINWTTQCGVFWFDGDDCNAPISGADVAPAQSVSGWQSVTIDGVYAPQSAVSAAIVCQSDSQVLGPGTYEAQVDMTYMSPAPAKF